MKSDNMEEDAKIENYQKSGSFNIEMFDPNKNKLNSLDMNPMFTTKKDTNEFNKQFDKSFNPDGDMLLFKENDYSLKRTGFNPRVEHKNKLREIQNYFNSLNNLEKNEKNNNNTNLMTKLTTFLCDINTITQNNSVEENDLKIALELQSAVLAEMIKITKSEITSG
jgi:hypothetical protein